LNVGISTKDEDVRDRLLLYTPKGSDATNVLAFIVDDLHPKWDFLSYFAYADALQVGRTGRLNVVREDERWPGLEPPPPDWTPRFIYLVIGTYSDGNYIWKITANWK